MSIVSIASLSKKSVVAALLVLPLTLSACSRDEEDSAPSSSSSSSSQSTTTTTSTSTATPERSEEEKAEENGDNQAEQPRPEDERERVQQAQQEQLEAARQAAQQAAVAAPDQQPIEGGQPANEKDKQEIEQLVRGWGEQTTLRSFMEYANNNTCRRVIESNGGYAAGDPSKVPDVSLQDQPNLNLGVQDVSDIQVNGDSASAQVTPTGPNAETSTMRFEREDGRWTMCN